MLIDAHAHLDRYGPDLPTVLDEITKERILTIGNSMDVESYDTVRRIADQKTLVIPAFGIHPWNAPDYAESLPSLDQYIKQCALIGELGLDFHFEQDKTKYPCQIQVFEYLLSAAQKYGKIVNLHTKGAENEILGYLRGATTGGIIIHWYSGPLEWIPRFLDIGAYFTIGVEILFSLAIREIAMKIPLDRLLTETDNPGAMMWLCKKQGRPSDIRKVIKVLSDSMKLSEDNLTEIISRNFSDLILPNRHLEKWSSMYF